MINCEVRKMGEEMTASVTRNGPALGFELIAKCSTTKARVSRIHLPHQVGACRLQEKQLSRYVSGSLNT